MDTNDVNDSLTWKRIDPTETQRVGYRTLVEKNYILPDGLEKSFTTIGKPGERAAGTIAITTDGKVIVAKQYRPGPDKLMYEIPGGGVEDGEDPQVAAARELEEETGYKPGSIKPLGTTCRDAYMNGTWHYYLATDCVLTGNGQKLDESEYVEVCLIDIDKFIENARNDLMTDAISVLLAYDELMELRSKQHDQ